MTTRPPGSSWKRLPEMEGFGMRVSGVRGILGLYWGYIGVMWGIMEEKMETTIMGYVCCRLRAET